MELTPKEAFWILANLPTAAPFGPDSDWMEMRNAVAVKLSSIRDLINQCPTCGYISNSALCKASHGR